MSAEVMKMELENEVCCVCGNGGDLLTPEEHDADTPMPVPLRTMLLQLNSSKVIPEGRLCASCIRRTVDAYEFSSSLSNKTAPPLSEKIRALRKRLHELTQKIDVFIVVGGTGDAGSYSEEDIIVVEREALAAAAAADAEELERAKNAKGDNVYQCSVCPESFQRAADYRTHAATHSADALHSCWTCGAQFAARAALLQHAQSHSASRACQLCGAEASSAAELRRHAASCAPRCVACRSLFPDREALSSHVASAHGRGSAGPFVCPSCFRTLDSPELLTAHLLRHRQARQFVCGYDSCILRFVTRNSLMAHIRKCHSGEVQEAPEAPAPPEAPVAPPTSVQCHSCPRQFGSVAAMKRHARVHRRQLDREQEQQAMEEEEWMEEAEGEAGEEVEYLEVETLDEAEHKPSLPDLM